MGEKQETIADILAEIRLRGDTPWKHTRPDGYGGYETITINRNEYLISIADRIEAAHKREATAEKSSAVDNGAKMREALEDSNGLLEELAAIGEWCESAREQIADNKAALAAPPRNCDIHTDFNDAITTLANKRNWHDGKWNSERYCILASWLLAPATEKEGENDEDN